MLRISPQGTIFQVSQGHGGRATDVAITLDSTYVAVGEEPSFLRKLLPGDVVLADRGFLIEQHVAEELAHLVTPAFKGTRPRLTN